MIADELRNASVYRNMSGIREIMDYIEHTDLRELPDGRTDIDGDRLYVMIQRPDLKPCADALPEAHDRYMDFQLVLEGGELMGYALRRELGDPVKGDPDHDIFFYRQPDDMTLLPVREGMFAVFYPEDAHAPCIRMTGCDTSVKAVFKWKVTQELP